MNIGFWGYFTVETSRGLITRPALVVAQHGNLYNVLVFVDGTNDTPASDSFARWATSVELTEYATLGCLSRRPDRSPDDLEADRVAAEKAEVARLEAEAEVALAEALASNPDGLAKLVARDLPKSTPDPDASEPAARPAKSSKKTSSTP